MSIAPHTGVEIERKYIIEKPDFDLLASFKDYKMSEITQIYLPSDNGVTRRVRKRITDGQTVYIETKKIRIDKMSATEIERELSAEEYESMARDILDGTSPIRKTRHVFVYMGQEIEIDVYPAWKSTCIMETELESRETAVEFPSCIHIVREVTGNKAYSNAGMARSFPAEDVI